MFREVKKFRVFFEVNCGRVASAIELAGIFHFGNLESLVVFAIDFLVSTDTDTSKRDKAPSSSLRYQRWPENFLLRS